LALTTEQRNFWRDNGFLVIGDFFTQGDLDVVTSSLERAWIEARSDVVVDDLFTSRRARMSDLSEEEKQHIFKVNDLYLASDEVRNVCLSQRVGPIVRELLEDDPVLCNTLNLEYGSQQPDHVDTLFMTPHTPGKLVATWMALEDAVPDAGPLRYYPGSNHIEPYRFKDGGYHYNDPEMPIWADYMAGQVDRHGLGEERFLAKKGDLFIWHASLLHGGSEICRPGLTRNSLVSHFWTKSDCRVHGKKMKPTEGGEWLVRAPQFPEGDLPDDENVSGTPAPGRSLYDRIRSLVTSRG
jgi:phytanoyl-CoA hydroxylase